MFGSFTRGNRPPARGSIGPVMVYGTEWCAATQMVRRYLERMGVPYTFHDMDADPAAARRVEWWTGGYRSHPTVQVGGDLLVEPSTSELHQALVYNGLA
jgi:mycoredoxin